MNTTHADQPGSPERGDGHTAAEIRRQPTLWRALAEALDVAAPALDRFLADWLADPLRRVILTGAGSSGFIADMVADQADMQCQAQVRTIHTTSLLTHPAAYLQRDRPTLLVSFARSGSSPESTAAVDLVRDTVANTRFLDITCNPDGDLVRCGRDRDDTLALMMPAASCDRGFAMTGSLTCMLLAALATFDAAPWPQRLQRLRALADLAEQALAQWQSGIEALARIPFARVVYLGSGPLEATAREAALKLVELTAGRVATFAGTPLGFRHGPKSLLDRGSLVIVLRSVEPLARRYEDDLLAELRRDGVAGQVLSVGPSGNDAPGDFSLAVPSLPDPWLAPLWLTMAQRYALQRSLSFGLTPDNPFPDGTVNRVVQGVAIHRHG